MEVEEGPSLASCCPPSFSPVAPEELGAPKVDPAGFENAPNGEDTWLELAVLDSPPKAAVAEVVDPPPTLAKGLAFVEPDTPGFAPKRLPVVFVFDEEA